MKIIWRQNEKDGYKQIANYIKLKFGIKAKRKFVTEVTEYEKLLCQHPNMASIDPLFETRARTYRSVLINNLSKMVYYLEDDIIYISAFWDCRSNPITQAQQVKD